MDITDIIRKVAEEDMVITVSDAREYLGGCIPGWKQFAEANNLNWKQVRKHGMKASELLAINDLMATKLVIYVYGRK